MKLDPLRRHAAMATATGLALAALASCTTSTKTGPAASVTIPATAVRLPLADRVAAGLERIRATAQHNPPGEQWGHYQDEGGRIWYFWPLPDGRFCHGKEFELGDQDIQEVGCTSNPLPDDGTPAVNALLGPASVTGGRWVSFLYADQEDVQDIACGDLHFTARRIARFPGTHGPRTLYAVSTPWAALGLLHARVRRADGTIAPDLARFPDGSESAHVSGERVCA
ncbi:MULTISPECIES: hypothetical protein [unclassified Kitasatospora]|uniref:hypothetical protein n=1 Tax=unclassified Kitasatospora TaxID=2633591 RepID=UPI0034068C7F